MNIHTEIRANADELKELSQKRWDEIVPIVSDNAELFGLLSGYKNKLDLELALVAKYMSSGEFDKAIANLGYAQRNYGAFFCIAQGEWRKAKYPLQIIKAENIAPIPAISGEKAEQFLKDHGL